jgi:lactate racemase
MARITAFSPGQSPPPVNTATLIAPYVLNTGLPGTSLIFPFDARPFFLQTAAGVERPLLFSGFELITPALPEYARVLRAPLALPGLMNFRAAVEQALEEPMEGPSLPQLLKPNQWVSVVIDDFSLPVPPLLYACRRKMLEAVLELLAEKGLGPDRVAILVANGLSRQWRPAELLELLGPMIGNYPVKCHDAERVADVVRLGEEPAGPLELNSAVVKADLVLYLNVVSTPLHAGLFGLISGTVPYRTARLLNAPKLFEGEMSPLVPGSPHHRAHQKVADLLTQRTQVMQVTAMLNNDLWAPGLSSLMHSGEELSRPLQMWNALPQAVRLRAARLLKAAYRPIGVVAGAPRVVEPRALEVYYRQNEVEVEGSADVVVIGVPDQGPGSVKSSQNPVLAANLGLGYLANLYTAAPPLRQGGVLILANPLTREFDTRVHAPHLEFYEKVLREERAPEAIHERFETLFATRPQFVDAYQQRFAFHGAHPLFSWYANAPARSRAGRIIVANGDPRACARFGFSPAVDIEDALIKSREFLGTSEPKTYVLELPPPFWVRVV